MSRTRTNHNKEGSDGCAKWLTTFNDLMTLLMVFFVLLFTMGTLDTKKLRSFQGSLQSGLGILEAGEKVSIGVIEPHRTSEVNSEEGMTGSMEDLNSLPGVDAAYTHEGIMITLQDAILFQSGIADINPIAFPILNSIIDIIQDISRPIRVEGHTDNDPIHTERYPSNWELSTERAVNVLKYFSDKGKIPPERLSAMGYGESRPVFPNDTPEHKARNRRVEIVLVMEEEK
ncbi:MAG: OmpA family protein [Desulfatiglandaceae bacterium]